VGNGHGWKLPLQKPVSHVRILPGHCRDTSVYAGQKLFRARLAGSRVITVSFRPNSLGCPANNTTNDATRYRSRHHPAVDGYVHLTHPGWMIELSEQQIIDEQQIVDEIADRLAGAYSMVSPEAVQQVVRDKYAQFDGRPIRDFVPLFVERHARAALAKLAA
jgi:hypothetical protein